MGWINNFLEKMMPTKETYGGDPTAIVIDFPPQLYYKELAIHTAASLISNAISKSEIQCYIDGKPQKNEDYFLLNVSPNRNETSSVFWHKVINTVIRKKEALIVEVSGRLYCADAFTRGEERPIKGDIFESVTIGNLTLTKRFTQKNAYLLSLDNMNVKQLIDGMYKEYGEVLSAAVKGYKASAGQKLKLQVDGIRAGDEEFNKELETYLKDALKEYIQNDNAIFIEYSGRTLSQGDKATKGSAADVIAIKQDLFKTVATAFHIPESMMTGNINNVSDVVSAFLTFGVDPFGDMISEALNKRAGPEHFAAGDFYRVDTGKIKHRDIFDMATSVVSLISSGTMCVDEVREEIGMAPLNTSWSRKHFITKNFEELDRFLKAPAETEKGGEEVGEE